MIFINLKSLNPNTGDSLIQTGYVADLSLTSRDVKAVVLLNTTWRRSVALSAPFVLFTAVWGLLWFVLDNLECMLWQLGKAVAYHMFFQRKVPPAPHRAGVLCPS